MEELLENNVPEEITPEIVEAPKEEKIEKWIPKTSLGKKVKNGEITTIGEILDKGVKILESGIVDFFLPNLTVELLEIGQSKGKFGGGKKSIWKQTQKKTKEGNKPKFATMAIVGNADGYIGLGYGKAKETIPAREKATRNAKLNIMRIRRGCGSWACGCGEPHSIPFESEGKCSSVKIRVMPAPKGTGLAIEKEAGKILRLAGIKDVYSKSYGQRRTKINMITALISALKNLNTIKVQQSFIRKSGLCEGPLIKNGH